MNKICTLLDLTQKEIKRSGPLNDNAGNKDVSLEMLLDLKRFYEINSLCTLEIFHHLHSVGLISIGLTIIKLFQAFKNQMADFVKYNVMFFKTKGLYIDNNIDTPRTEGINMMSGQKKRQSNIL